jgi:serine/threonine-protein kinase
MAEVVLDSRGRLRSFYAVPPQVEPSPPATAAAAEPDWSPFLRETGLETTALLSVTPLWAAPVDSDRKAAWEVPYPGADFDPVRIEAAAYHGRPVWFAVLPPWTRPDRVADARRIGPETPLSDVGVFVLAVAMPIGGIVLARRNLRLGRGDRKGAFRVALFVFVAFSVARALRAEHVSTFGDELWTLIKVLAYPTFWAVQVWLLYLALEPYARRRWPHMLISWKRLLAGRVRDPLVGRDLLIGAAAAIAYAGTIALTFASHVWTGGAVAAVPPWIDGPTLTSFRNAGFRLFVNQFSAVLYALAHLFLLVLLRALVRRTWLAIALWCLVVSGGPTWPGVDPRIAWGFAVVRALIVLVVMMRAGLLALATMMFFAFATFEVPLTLDVTAWFGTRAFPVLLPLVALAVYGFWTALAGKPLFGRPLLED